jgi:mono/diheme cytochrome c family protein
MGLRFMNPAIHSLVYAMLTGVSALACAQTASAESRGALLYNTHCVACHTTQMHWRNGRQAVDWESLKFQVWRWQSNTGLTWEDGDIAEVARYLNDTIYHHPRVNDRVVLPSTRPEQPTPRK